MKKLNTSPGNKINARCAELHKHKGILEVQASVRTADVAGSYGELARSKQMLENIAQGITESIMLISKDYKILWANKAALQQTGLSMEELIGTYCYRATHHREEPCEPPCDPCPLSELLKTSHSKTEEHIHYDKNNQRLFVEVAVYPIKDESGQIDSFVHVTRDITERKKAETLIEQYSKELEQSNKELDQFASIASHDLQQPLRVVSGFAQLLQRRYKEKLDADAVNYISYIIDGTEQMQKLIDDLLAFARVGTRGKPFAPVDCNDILRKTLANLALAIDESHATIIAGPLPTVVADDTQLIQLFQNIVGNAIKYCSAQPRIQITAERIADAWLFRVGDNGIGIVPENFERIFEVFQRLHSKDEYPGTGMGLSICKRIVERHGGRIWVESRITEGSAFFFTIPDRQAEP